MHICILVYHITYVHICIICIHIIHREVRNLHTAGDDNGNCDRPFKVLYEYIVYIFMNNKGRAAFCFAVLQFSNFSFSFVLVN